MQKLKFTTGIILLIIFLSNNIVLGQTTGKQTTGMLKESPAGSKTLRFIKAVNKDLTVNESFITTNFTAAIIDKVGGSDKLVTMLQKDIPTEDGALTIYSVNRPSNFEYEYIANASKSGWLKIIFHMDNKNPYKIKGFELEGIDKPAGVGEPMNLK